MDHEFDQKPNDSQDKRQQAREDLKALQKLMEQLDLIDDLPDKKTDAPQAATDKPKQEETAEKPHEKAEHPEIEDSVEQPEDKPAEPVLSVDELIERAAAASETEAPEDKPEIKREEPLSEAAERKTEQKSIEEETKPAPKKKDASAVQKKKTNHTSNKKKNSKAAKLRRRRRRLIVLGTGIVIVLLLIVLLVSAVRALGNRDKNKDTMDAGSAVVLTEEEQLAARQKEGPASQQESKQYRAIKDDTSLPDYAKEYPGLYADAVEEENKLSRKKVCYLTFDDGPSDTNTPKILDTLAKEGVKATFFVVASEIDDDTADILKRIVKEGHTLCIHANEHEYSKIYQSTEAYLADFAAAYDKIYELTGYRVQGFRFPGGSNGQVNKSGCYDAIVTEMTRRGFEYYDWNAYSHDAEGGNYTVEEMVDYALHEVTISSRNDVILLMHDTYGKEKTTKVLQGIIDGLNEEGIEMLPITNTTRPVHFEVNDTTPPEYDESAEDEDSTDVDTDDTDDSDSNSKEKKQY